MRTARTEAASPTRWYVSFVDDDSDLIGTTDVFPPGRLSSWS
jgi:hypothetical protein